MSKLNSILLPLSIVVILVASCKEPTENTAPLPREPSIRVSLKARAEFLCREYSRSALYAPFTLINTFTIDTSFNIDGVWRDCCGWMRDNEGRFQFGCGQPIEKGWFDYTGIISSDLHELVYLEYAYHYNRTIVHEGDTLPTQLRFGMRLPLPHTLIDSTSIIRVLRFRGAQIYPVVTKEWGVDGTPYMQGLYYRDDSLTHFMYDDSSRLDIEMRFEP